MVLEVDFDKIAGSIELATVVEVSSFKPGNVSPEHDFEDTSYEDFLQGCIALRPTWRTAVEKGFQARTGDKHLSKIGLGELILDGVKRVKDSHSGGNTHLGTIMLLVPLAAGAGVYIAQENRPQNLRMNVKNLLQHSTLDDAVDLYKAIRLAEPGGLGRDEELDIGEDESLKAIEERQISFLDIMRRSAKKDLVAKEISTYYPITFEEGFPAIDSIKSKTGNLRKAVVHTFLFILLRHHDTLIERKAGSEQAAEVSRLAEDVLQKGGVISDEGLNSIREFHNHLISTEKNKLNPGTTADLTASSLAFYLLSKQAGIQ
ncbi:triphosphoribosyl-dephospho-CoA synthase [Candidatus Altiarchaeota archaeon]